MTIIKTSKEMSAVEKYAMTKNADIAKMSDIKAGTKVNVKSWLLYEDVNQKTGERQQILSVDTGKGVYATNSPTFVRDFMDMVEIFSESGDVLNAFKMTGGTSKAGRAFITCALAD